MHRLRWDSFTLIADDGTVFDHATEPVIYVKCMTKFWQTGRTGNFAFGRLGLPHEDKNNPKTWGPPTRDDVDWIGFPARNNLLTVFGAAKALGVTPARIRALCSSGRMGFKVGRDWLISGADIEANRDQRRPGRPRKENPVDTQ